MKLWLVRHAQPLVATGVCYGALDVAADPRATHQAAQALAVALPANTRVISSPLQRCEQLKQVLRGLRPDLSYESDHRLVEMDFGRWEGQHWDAITRAELDGWTASFDTWRCGGAESVQDVMARVGAVWDETLAYKQPTVWLTHAGVIRAANLLARGQRQIDDARQWPSDAPAWGAWQVLEIQHAKGC
ncbi:MAG: histidine phosphatase family protein [Pseudomonadota bacterium]